MSMKVVKFLLKIKMMGKFLWYKSDLFEFNYWNS